MNIGIVGGGSIGLLFSYYLSKENSITLYVRNEKQLKIIERDGLILHKQNNKYKTTVDVKHVSEWKNSEQDLSLICLKQYDLPNLLENGVPKHPLLFVQNGMGHLKWLNQLANEVILVGTIEHGALKLNDNNVFHTGEGLTRIAYFKGKNELLIASLINGNNQFPFSFEKDFREMLLKKLVANALINPLTAILKVNNGGLIENPHYFQIFKEIFNEIKVPLSLKNEQMYFENAVSICKKTKENRSSMLKDVEEGRKTEVEAILGYILEEAQKKNVETPIVRTLYHCIKGIESDGEER